MKDFNIKKFKKNANIDIEIYKKNIFKNFFCEYKLYQFINIIIIILLTIIGIKSQNIKLFISLQCWNFFILLIYLIVILCNIIQYSYIFKVDNDVVYIKDLFNKYKFNIRDFLSIKIESMVTDNQDNFDYNDDLYYPSNYKIKSSLLFDAIFKLVTKLRKVKKEYVYIEIEFINNNKLTKLKIPYKNIKNINNNQKIYQYISENDIDNLLSLFKTIEDNNDEIYDNIRTPEREIEIQELIRNQEEENRRKELKITVSKKDFILLGLFVIGFLILCYIVGVRSRY